MKNEQLIERVEKRVDKAIKGKTFTSETARAWAECSLAFSRALREELAAVPRAWRGEEIKDAPEGLYALREPGGTWYEVCGIAYAKRLITPFEFFGPLPTNTEDTE